MTGERLYLKAARHSAQSGTGGGGQRRPRNVFFVSIRSHVETRKPKQSPQRQVVMWDAARYKIQAVCQHFGGIFSPEDGSCMFFRKVGRQPKLQHTTRTEIPTSEDGDSMFLQDIGIHLQVHAALQPRRPQQMP